MGAGLACGTRSGPQSTRIRAETRVRNTASRAARRPQRGAAAERRSSARQPASAQRPRVGSAWWEAARHGADMRWNGGNIQKSRRARPAPSLPRGRPLQRKHCLVQVWRRAQLEWRQSTHTPILLTSRCSSVRECRRHMPEPMHIGCLWRALVCVYVCVCVCSSSRVETPSGVAPARLPHIRTSPVNLKPISHVLQIMNPTRGSAPDLCTWPHLGGHFISAAVPGEQGHHADTSNEARRLRTRGGRTAPMRHEPRRIRNAAPPVGYATQALYSFARGKSGSIYPRHMSYAERGASRVYRVRPGRQP